MITVLADESEHSVASEFFELFKTPWQFYTDNCHGEVLICSNDQFYLSSARLILVYGTRQERFDQKEGIKIRSRDSNRVLKYKGDRIPIYGSSFAFENSRGHALADERTGDPLAVEFGHPKQIVLRIGFDLFFEIRRLLTGGQPACHAAIPTLELHIALLRDLILSYSIPLVEIAPIPAGYNSIVCLTHDVDHPGIRNHKLDQTMFGFLYRAIVGSLINLCRGRNSIRDVAANWIAAFSLPFIYLGWARDFWRQIEHYLEIEKGLTSTFFILPKKGDPGRYDGGPAPSLRAAKYDLVGISDEIQKLISAKREIGLHGIDAWRDETEGHVELTAISRLTGAREIGVRMHWLYFHEQSPAVLEKAGFSYDSTVGYNDTIGYRAGTIQVFKPIGVERMLELPLHIMDTALFYPAHMHLSPEEARRLVDGLTKTTRRFGGVLTLNWHDRSIAPERLWGDFYVELLENLKRSGPWFASGGDCVSWFRKRRSASIETFSRESTAARAKVSVSQDSADLPGLRLRVHKPPAYLAPGSRNDEYHANFADFEFNDCAEIEI